MPKTPPTPIVIPSGTLYATWGDTPSSTASYAESPDSASFAIDMQQRSFTKIRGTYASLLYAVNSSPFPAFGMGTILTRGALGTPTNGGGYWKVESVKLSKSRGSMGLLEIVWLGTLLPPDDARLTPENLQPRIERHPIFQSLAPLDFAIVRQAAEAPNAQYRNIATQQIAGTSNPQLATLLYNKLLGGQETYYFATFRYTWDHFYVFGYQPSADQGGYIQNPGVYTAPLIGSLPAGFDWLREADNVEFLSGVQQIVKFTRNWLGGPVGNWDTDLYS